MRLLITISTFLIFTALVVGCTYSGAQESSANKSGQYQCTPCGSDCDNISFDKEGNCPHCGMALVKKSTVTFKTIQPSEICDYINKHPGVVLLDVRTKEEFEGKANPDFGTLKNAVNMPVQELEKRLADISSLKNKEIIVYCSHSHRSPRASYILTQNGFTNVTNMAGGMSVMKDNSCKK
jgi:rhodanese-related sulfurtransferase/DNA-directed RNA polymerase subunit RPC12/RpoP